MKNSWLFRVGIFEVDKIGRQFTPKLFENYFTLNIFYLLPSGIGGYVLVEILNGNLEIIYENILFIFISIFFLILGIYVMWKIGLKKYEAFG
jgi:hypothetical protein